MRPISVYANVLGALVGGFGAFFAMQALSPATPEIDHAAAQRIIAATVIASPSLRQDYEVAAERPSAAPAMVVSVRVLPQRR